MPKTSPNKVISSRQIFRLAAVIYAENSSINTNEVVKNIVEACFIESNVEMNIEDILAYCMEHLYINFTYSEIFQIMETFSSNFISNKYENCTYYKLTEKRLIEYQSEQSKNIEYFIKLFINKYPADTAEAIEQAMYKFLYELTTTNINSYRKLISKGIKCPVFKDSELSVDQRLFSEEEKEYISLFLNWDNEDKNSAITDIIICCLEYCLIVSGDTKINLTETFINNKTIFLDTNIIFRALGINGKSRKEIVISLLEKCKQGNVNICISSFTEREFFNTIENNIQKIVSYARGKISMEVYDGIADYSIFSFYNEWRQEHDGLSFNYFKSYIRSLYLQLLENFNIVNDSKIPYNPYNEKEKKIIQKYNDEIYRIKEEMSDQNYYYNPDEYYVTSNTHDANLVLWLEKKREGNHEEENKSDYYLISSDKSLRYWDLRREKEGVPIVIYPSHFFSLLIRTCGRAKNDLKSFVSFINLRPKSNTIKPERADAILSGISVVTEDICTQKALVKEILNDGMNSSILSDDFDELEIYEKAKLFSLKYLEKEFERQGKNLLETQEKIAAIEEKFNTLEQENKDSVQKGALYEEKNERLLETINRIARKGINFKYICVWWTVPLVIMIFNLISISFIALQLLFCDSSWNFVPKIFTFISTHTFLGKTDDFNPYAVDLVLISLSIALNKKFMKNPFSRKKRQDFINDLIQNYIEDEKLLN